MALRTILLMIDDLDGSEATETVSFGLDGQQYEIDLNETHAADLRRVLATFTSVARHAPASTNGGRTRSAVSTSRGTSDIDPKAVRAWADANGVQVNARGRLATAVVQRYRAAQG